ncbi:coiled-coil domain-containing protein 85C [Microplitis mediator]|uniref:coiled-coil domain-containing protein 85C n=1 Tax=Microplitis mediator TaxID=375433 RepID=UPI00255319FF|nr:coiled-coil domain-containing protein 85C [Microplitis mediator]
MSNKTKSQQTQHQEKQVQQPQQHQQQQTQQQQQHQVQQHQLQQHQHQHQHHLLKQQQSAGQLPPQYQPPPQPTIGILKNSTGISGNPNALLNSYPQSQQSQRVTNIKDAQAKYLPKLDSLGTQSMVIGSTSNKPASHSYYPSKISPGQFLPSSSSSSSSYPGGNIIIPNTTKQRITDEEFMRLSPVEMLKFVRKTESDLARIVTEQNRQIQNLLGELRSLKEANQRLSDDNQELRDLCCFLDDDRQKGRKLAREWQRFGRYTASVMRQEVSAYQNKLRQLDNKQQELIKDNLELKELCLYLDEERGSGGAQRDDGDGSSSSTNAEETAAVPPPPPAPPRQVRHTSFFNDETMQYVRSLEQRVKQLEEDKSMLQARAQTWEAENRDPRWEQNTDTDNPHNLHSGSGRPEAVVQALQVLEVREQLERDAGHNPTEKALVREMCNVVWRKLEESPHMRR